MEVNLLARRTHYGSTRQALRASAEESSGRPPIFFRGHCHHKALMKMGDEEQVLKKPGLDCEVLDSGCCGMAGAFGFEKGEHYEVSMQCGERVLLPWARS